MVTSKLSNKLTKKNHILQELVPPPPPLSVGTGLMVAPDGQVAYTGRADVLEVEDVEGVDVGPPKGQHPCVASK